MSLLLMARPVASGRTRMTAGAAAGARVDNVSIHVRSNDGRSINLTLDPSIPFDVVKHRVASELGVPRSAVNEMSLKASDSRSRSLVALDDRSTPTVGDMTRVYGGAIGQRVRLLADNAHELSAKAAFDVCQILKHWLSPALVANRMYQAALAKLAEITSRVVLAPAARHSIAIPRALARVPRGIELLKKLGLIVVDDGSLATMSASADTRAFFVAHDVLSMERPVPAPASSARRPAPVPQRRRRVGAVRRLTLSLAALDMSYEALLGLENVRVGLDQSILQRLPVQTLHADQLVSNGAAIDCGICLQTFAKGDRVMRLPCFHAFHVECAGTWLARSKRCPHDMMEVVLDQQHEEEQQ